jgi:hypothetical protein
MFKIRDYGSNNRVQKRDQNQDSESEYSKSEIRSDVIPKSGIKIAILESGIRSRGSKSVIRNSRFSSM